MDQTLQGFSYASKSYGADVLAYTSVIDIKTIDGEVAQVVTDQVSISTKCVVNAAGIWAPKIGEMVGLEPGPIALFPRNAFGANKYAYVSL